MSEVREMAKAVINQINSRTDEISEEMAMDHFAAMQLLDYRDAERERKEVIASLSNLHLDDLIEAPDRVSRRGPSMGR